MMAVRYVICMWLALVVACVFSIAWCADFTQAERDAQFIKDARRKDGEIKAYFGEMVPAGIDFCHQGSYKAIVHRSGLNRPLTLIPVRQLVYPGVEELRAGARIKVLVVGVLSLTYGHSEPELAPGSRILVYDGLNIELHDVHGYSAGELPASIGPPPGDAPVDPVLGSLEKTPFSLAHITAGGEMRLYIQLVDEDGLPITGDDDLEKAQLVFNIPGIVDDDNSPDRVLAQPLGEGPEEEVCMKPEDGA